MTNILQFPTKPQKSTSCFTKTLCIGVAETRRVQDDVFWLKENAELLSMFAATGAALDHQALSCYVPFYDQIEEKLRFYPQYYRFFLSICLDLEDLGLAGTKGASICKWIANVGLVEAELSDLQRAEAKLLLARRGAAKPPSEGELGHRLRCFIERPETFALPNKKAAYELTHIVYYLSQYGRIDPELAPPAVTSLLYLGVVAFLDQDHDLLAEVCLALHYAGHEPSEIWLDAVDQAHRAIAPVSDPRAFVEPDGFHALLVTGWTLSTLGRTSFQQDFSRMPLFFRDPGRIGSALRPLSERLYDLGDMRSAEWAGMRRQVIPFLDSHSREILQKAEQSTSMFEGFFEKFARAAST